MNGDATSSAADRRLAELWREHGRPVLAYATRHVSVEDAEEVAAETFVVAWRRLEDVPDEALPWLLVTARNVMRTRRRSARRRHAAQRELQRAVEGRAVDSAESTAVEKVELVGALWRLSATEREALFLVAWDGLSLADGAQVAGCSVSAFTMRVSRARARLRTAVQSSADPPPWRGEERGLVAIGSVKVGGRRG